MLGGRLGNQSRNSNLGPNEGERDSSLDTKRPSWDRGSPACPISLAMTYLAATAAFGPKLDPRDVVPSAARQEDLLQPPLRHDVEPLSRRALMNIARWSGRHSARGHVMRIRDRMSPDPRSTGPDALCVDALALMHRHHIRRLPVVDEDGALIGIVTEGDLRFLTANTPESAARKVRDVMQANVVTVSPGDAIEHAARRMYIDRLRALPVLEAGRLVGIITETDIFKVFLQMMGIAENAVRVMVEVDDEPGQLHELTRVIRAHDANIVSLVTLPSPDRASRWIVIRMIFADPAALGPLLDTLREQGYKPDGPPDAGRTRGKS